MKILIIDGPGVHPVSAARALGGGLHRKGHVVIVHPVKLRELGWFPKYGIERRVSKILAVHQPDVMHVFSAEPWFADAFTGRGISVVHSAYDRPSRADWIVAPEVKYKVPDTRKKVRNPPSKEK